MLSFSVILRIEYKIEINETAPSLCRAFKPCRSGSDAGEHFTFRPTTDPQQVAYLLNSNVANMNLSGSASQFLYIFSKTPKVDLDDTFAIAHKSPFFNQWHHLGLYLAAVGIAAGAVS